MQRNAIQKSSQTNKTSTCKHETNAKWTQYSKIKQV